MRKCYGCKREFLPAVSADDQYVLVIAESDWYWDKQSMKWSLGRKSNRYFHMLPQSVGAKCRLQTGYKRQTENKGCFSSDTHS